MIRDKKILITGGSSGLGLALARRLAAHNALGLVARDAAKLDRVVAELRAAHPEARVTGHAIDVSGPDAGRRLAEVVAQLGGLDVLVNSAGILREGRFSDLGEEAFRSTFETNFFGTVAAVRALLPALTLSHGHIVNIASIAGLTGVYGYSAYSSSKFALIGLSESLHFELAPHGVRVQVACPPEFDSPMVDALERTRSPENRAHVLTIPKLDIDACADGILAGMSGASFLIVPGAASKLVAFGLRHLPALSRWVAARTIRAASRARATTVA